MKLTIKFNGKKYYPTPTVWFGVVTSLIILAIALVWWVYVGLYRYDAWLLVYAFMATLYFEITNSDQRGNKTKHEYWFYPYWLRLIHFVVLYPLGIYFYWTL